MGICRYGVSRIGLKRGNLRQYHAIGIDVGDQNGLPSDTTTLHQVLDKHGIATAGIQAPPPIASNIMSCHFSARISAFRRAVSRQFTKEYRHD